MKHTYTIFLTFFLFPFFLFSQTIPTGFNAIDSTSNGEAILYKNAYKSNPDYVQVINLTKGGVVKLLNGAPVSGGSADSPKYTRLNITNAWNDFSGSYNNAFSIVNGEFFGNATAYTAEFSYPVKESGVMISHGFGNSEPWVKRQLRLWGQYAEVASYNNDPQTIESSACPSIIVGADKSAPFQATNAVARTFIGVMDGNNDGLNELVLIFSSITSTQANAAGVLQDFGVGADDMIMLDGGGSGQMICKDFDYVNQTRLLPQFVGVYIDSTLVNISNFEANQPKSFINIISINNPFNDKLNINYEMKEDVDFDVILFDLTGRMLKKSSYSKGLGKQNIITINTDDIPKGLYLCKLSSTYQNIAIKVMK